ncbi:MAG: Uma2 family endonuclease [Actinomycetota bacterium]
MATQPDAPTVEVYDEIAGTPKEPVVGLTYDDLVRMFPEDDNVRRELIGGELIAAPLPSTRHQEIVGEIFAVLRAHAKETGGKAFVAPTGVLLATDTMVEPDVLFVRAERADQIEDPFVRGAPDLVVEVSSPSTRRLDTVRKRELYQRFGVPEYLYVDLDSERVEIYRLVGDRYQKPIIVVRGEVVESEILPGFSVEVAYLFGPAD